MAHHGHSVEEYLETIYFLAFPVGEYGPVVRTSPALQARVAEMLGVTPASASEMLRRLEADGLIERGRRTGTLLTEKGRAAAERVVRHHRLIERFLTDFLGYTAAEAHERAEEMGDAFDEDALERMAERLGHPDRCPHGWPVDPTVEQAENRELLALSDLPEGAAASIVRLAEHDGELLGWFYDQGLVPGTEVVLDRREPAAGQLTLRVGAKEQVIGERAAQGLFVRAA